MLRPRAQPWIGLLTLCCVGLASSATRARAQTDALAIAWRAEGEPPCTKPEQAEQEVLRLAQPPLAPAQFEVRCRSEGERGAQRCAVRVVGRSGESERVLASCAEARETMLLIMAMALTPAPPVAGAPVAAPADEPVPRESARGRWLLSLAALADYGTLPGANLGPSLALNFALRGWRLGIAARYLPPRAAADLPEGVEAEVSWFAAALTPAWVWRVGAWGIGPRIELELGLERGRARGVEQASPANAIWAAGAAGALLEVWLHPRIALELVALVGAPARRPRFGFAGDAPFYTATAYFVRGTLGLTFRLDAKD
ncbi:MAG TPA: hypothetical protein VFZ61_24285 [Polyangiales bacterium]